MLLSFFTLRRPATLTDPVATTCSWPVRDIVEFLVSAGFTVTEEHNAPGGAHTALTSRLR